MTCQIQAPSWIQVLYFLMSHLEYGIRFKMTRIHSNASDPYEFISPYLHPWSHHIPAHTEEQDVQPHPKYMYMYVWTFSYKKNIDNYIDTHRYTIYIRCIYLFHLFILNFLEWTTTYSLYLMYRYVKKKQKSMNK